MAMALITLQYIWISLAMKGGKTKSTILWRNRTNYRSKANDVITNNKMLCLPQMHYFQPQTIWHHFSAQTVDD